MNRPTPIGIRHLLGGILLLCFSGTLSTGQSTTVVSSGDFKKTVLTRDFLSEGVAVADLNKDGRMDIVAGYYWFEAPNWTRHGDGAIPHVRPAKRIQQFIPEPGHGCQSGWLGRCSRR